MEKLMRYLKLFLPMTIFAVLAFPAFAKPPKGGGGTGGDPVQKPSVSYEVGFLSVPGLIHVYGGNDYGKYAVSIRVSEVNDAVNTTATTAAAIIDITGNVTYLDNLLPAESTWDLRTAWKVNNVGQVIGTGFDQGVPKSFLATPNITGTGYEVVGIPNASDLTETVLSESGDVLYEADNFQFFIRMSDGTVAPLPGGAEYFDINSSGELIGSYLDGANYTGFSFIEDATGDRVPLEVLSGSSIAGVSDLADSGRSAGIQNRQVKVRGGWINEAFPVTYDPAGNATAVSFPNTLNLTGRVVLNEQSLSSQPLIAGADVYRGRIWVRFPGYEVLDILDLMDPTQQQAFQALHFTSVTAGSSTVQFHMTTPRDSIGFVKHSGAPTFFGEAFSRYNETGNVIGFEGIYILGPVPQ